MGGADQRDIAAGELIDLELIRRFIVVAEELNFTRAEQTDPRPGSDTACPAVPARPAPG
jgi:hypothetical protein